MIQIKDKDFLAKAKEREKALLAEEKAEKYEKALAFLQERSMHLNQGNWERAGREEDEISFWFLLENLISKASRLLRMEDAECWKYRGLNEQPHCFGDGYNTCVHLSRPTVPPCFLCTW
ncbi:hypothetical protein P3L10_031076 [Capsicum annuum]